MRLKACKVFILITLICTSGVGADIDGKLEGIVTDASGVPLPGARIEIKHTSGKRALFTSDAEGRFLVDVSPSAILTVSLDAFETVSTMISPRRATLQVVLPLKQTLIEDVTVTAAGENRDAPAIVKLDEKSLEYVPIASQRFQDTLPLVPSVVRGPDGNINMAGSRASENSLLVNGANVTDPVTGNFAIELPFEAVETVDVYTNPYSAEFGKFTGGVTSISTRPGEDRFKIEFNDFVPRLHFVDGLKVEGIEAWKPRIRFSGPAPGIDRLYYSQAFQYQFLRTFFDDLPGDDTRNATRLTAFDSLTQVDYLPVANQQWSFTASVFPENSDNVNLNTFLPAPSTPDFEQRGFSFGAANRYFFSNGSALESLVSYKSYDVSILPKDAEDAPFTVTPEGMHGSFFNFQDRESGRFQWTETLTVRPLNWLGSHEIKSGIEWGRSGFSGRIGYSPVAVIRSDGSLAELNEFGAPQSIGVKGNEISAFFQDRWRPSREWTFDAGLRFDYFGLAENLNWAPRLAISYSPEALPRTTFKAGAGIFYDKIFLNAYEFESYPHRTVTTFDEQGNPTGSQVLRPAIAGEIEAPRGLTTHLEVNQELSSRVLVRVNFMFREGRDQFLVEPGGDELLLTQNGRSGYRQWEVTSRCRISRESQIFLSYVHSDARGDLNDFDSHFGNFQRPLIRENAYSYLPFDSTHRFLSWGVVKVPGQVYVSPVLEIRSGFRYSAVDQLQQYVGARNSRRFPVFAQLDLRITKTFEMLDRYDVMLGFKVYNFLNRFNPRDVQNNLDSPAFGTFYNGVGRTFRAAFEIQY